MSDFSPQDLVIEAKSLYGETTLRNRVYPDAPTPPDADKELLRIARTVVSRVAAAAESSVGWPLPGTWPEGSLNVAAVDISGTPYSQIWPDDLLQRALELFNFRTYSGMEGDFPQKVGDEGKAAEQFFMSLAKGAIGLGLGVDTDTATPEPMAARDRQGRNLLGDGAADNERILDTMHGPGWDTVL
jgi:hypothetical protein